MSRGFVVRPSSSETSERVCATWQSNSRHFARSQARREHRGPVPRDLLLPRYWSPRWQHRPACRGADPSARFRPPLLVTPRLGGEAGRLGGHYGAAWRVGLALDAPQGRGEPTLLEPAPPLNFG